MAAGEAAVVEDVGDLAVGVVIEQTVDLGDGAGWGLPEFPGGPGQREREGVVLPAAEPDVCGEGLGGSGHRDVGEQEPGDALAFPGRGGGVVPERGQVADQLVDPVLLGVGDLPDLGLAGFVMEFLGLAEGAQRGVPVSFEGVGNQPVGGVDGQVAAAGQVGVVWARSTWAARNASACSARCSSSAVTVKAASTVSGVRVSMSSTPMRSSRSWPGMVAQTGRPLALPSRWQT